MRLLNSTISKKATISFALVVAMVLLVSISSGLSFKYMEDFKSNILEYQKINSQTKIAKDMQVGILGVWRFFIQAAHSKNKDGMDVAKGQLDETMAAAANLSQNVKGDGDYTARLESIKGDAARMWDAGVKMLAAVIDEGQKESGTVKEYDDIANRLIQDVAEVANEEDTRAGLLGEMLKRIGKARNISLLVAAIVLVTGVVVLFFSLFLKRSVNPLNNLIQDIERISDGDLTVSVASDRQDEVGSVARSVDKMVDSLDTMIGTVLARAQTVNDTIEALRANAEKTTSGSKEQTRQAAQIGAAAEEMSQTVMEIASRASVASETSSEAIKAATSGQEIGRNAMDVVNRVYESTKGLAGTVGRLSARTQEIGEIVAVIDDIADQTNLLALNAAIEAARAGENGRGFAVVADEVRRLAEKTVNSTTEISGKIQAVQEESEKTKRSMDEASSEVFKATEHIRDMGDSLLLIVETVGKVGEQITQIATAVTQQAMTAEDMAKNVEGTRVISLRNRRHGRRSDGKGGRAGLHIRGAPGGDGRIQDTVVRGLNQGPKVIRKIRVRSEPCRMHGYS